MVTTATPSPPVMSANLPATSDGAGDPEPQNAGAGEGFVGLLVKSIFEPGANAAVVMAMNVSFFLLLLTLFALAFLTGWNQHVLVMLGVTTCLWAAMVWFVLELTKVQTRPDNMPINADGLIPPGPDKGGPPGVVDEDKKDR